MHAKLQHGMRDAILARTAISQISTRRSIADRPILPFQWIAEPVPALPFRGLR